MPAPQANLFATILSGIFDKAPVTWLLYGVGLVLSVLLVMMGIPPLAFAIGMYLPLQINTPLFIGGLISHWVAKSSKDAKVSEARTNRGTLLASGFIAGGALAGVLGAVLTLFGVARAHRRAGTPRVQPGHRRRPGHLAGVLRGVVRVPLLRRAEGEGVDDRLKAQGSGLRPADTRHA